MTNKNADKIRLLQISLKMDEDQYEKIIDRAARAETNIRKKRSRLQHLLSLSKDGNPNG